MKSPADLLAENDRLVRDLLADPDVTGGLAAYQSWTRVIEAAADIWDAAGPHDPSAAGSLGPVRAMINTTGPLTRPVDPDPRMVQISINLATLADTVRTSPSLVITDQRLLPSVLHVGYLATHATATALRQDLGSLTLPETGYAAALRRAVDHVATAEQVIDVHLHRPPARTPSVDPTRLDVAIAVWTTTAQQVLTQQTAKPKNIYIISDMQHGLLAHTAGLLRTATTDDFTSRGAVVDAERRVYGALHSSARSWDQLRRAWGQLATPTTGISRDLAVAARTLQQALREPALPHQPGALHSLVAALAVAPEIAEQVGNGLRTPELTGPADVVVALTRELLEQRPADDHFGVWRSLPRLHGRAAVPLPPPLRDEFASIASANVASARNLRSAAHSLLSSSSHLTQSTYRADRAPGRTAEDRSLPHHAGTALTPAR